MVLYQWVRVKAKVLIERLVDPIPELRDENQVRIFQKVRDILDEIAGVVGNTDQKEELSLDRHRAGGLELDVAQL